MMVLVERDIVEDSGFRDRRIKQRHKTKRVQFSGVVLLLLISDVASSNEVYFPKL